MSIGTVWWIGFILGFLFKLIFDYIVSIKETRKNKELIKDGTRYKPF